MPNVPNLDHIEETVQDARKCTENIVDIIQEPLCTYCQAHSNFVVEEEIFMGNLSG